MLAVAPIAGAAPASQDTSPLPSVSAKFDHTPTIVFPDTAAPTTRAVKVLQRGTGPRIAAGDLVVANYYGQIWRGKVFDSSFTQPIPFAFLIGVGKVIRGWDKTLVGQDVGSRVHFVVPPVDAYGAKGLPKAGITSKDTLVFVIDLLGACGPTAYGGLHPVPVRKGITVLFPARLGLPDLDGPVVARRDDPAPVGTVGTGGAAAHRRRDVHKSPSEARHTSPRRRLQVPATTGRGPVS
jgi:hypothetical protein